MVTDIRNLMSEDSDPVVASNCVDLWVRELFVGEKMHIRNLHSALVLINT